MNQDKTPEETLLEKYVYFATQNEYDSVIEAIKEYGKQEFERAIELAAENAVAYCEYKGDLLAGDAIVDKGSILKLKQP